VTAGHSIRKATKGAGQVNRSTFGYRTRPRTPGNREIRRLLLTDSKVKSMLRPGERMVTGGSKQPYESNGTRWSTTDLLQD